MASGTLSSQFASIASLSGTGTDVWGSGGSSAWNWFPTIDDIHSEVLLLSNAGFNLSAEDDGTGLDFLFTVYVNIFVETASFVGTPVVDYSAFFYHNGSAVGTDLKKSREWPLVPDTGPNGTISEYSATLSGILTPAQIDSSTFGFGIQCYSAENSQQAQVLQSTESIGPAGVVIQWDQTHPAAPSTPPWLAPTFTPTGNSNWARVRMNPLLRM